MLSLKHLNIKSFNENLAYLNKNCLDYSIDDISALSQVEIQTETRKIYAFLQIIEDDDLLAPNQLGLNDEAFADLGEEASLEEKAMVAAQSQALFQILDEGTSVADKSGELNSEELASYYKNVDRFENGTLVEEGTQDGVFSVDDAAGLTQFLMENMISQEYLEELYELYLEKYTLESQQK